jgi:hypothetical protein
MEFKEITTLYSEIYMKPTQALWAKSTFDSVLKQVVHILTTAL